MAAKQTILDLLAAGHEIAALVEADANVRSAENAARKAIAYFNAATALLDGFAELHSELIEHPQFVAARKFARKFRF